MTTRDELEQLARESIEAFNRADWEAIREITGPDYMYDETGTGRHVKGADELITVLKSWKSAMPDISGEVTRVLTDGDTVTLEIIWRGTQSGPLDTGTSVLPPSDKTFEIWAAKWQRWRGARLIHERHHLDHLSMLAQIGALLATATT